MSATRHKAQAFVIGSACAGLAPGDRLTLLEAGGGGMGDPRARVRGAVVADVQAGFISAETARLIYNL